MLLLKSYFMQKTLLLPRFGTARDNHVVVKANQILTFGCIGQYTNSNEW